MVQPRSQTSLRVLRGGSWRGNAKGCRSANRFGYSPGRSSNFLGFRVARVQCLPTVSNSIGMELVLIPAGEFVMGNLESAGGSDENRIRVTLTKPFYLGKYEVTQGQWQAVMKTRTWQGHVSVKEGRDFAATYVSWDDAMSFCRKLTKHEHGSGKLDRGWEYTLPTEAQWEFACRAGSTIRYSFGDDESPLREYAWY